MSCSSTEPTLSRASRPTYVLSQKCLDKAGYETVTKNGRVEISKNGVTVTVAVLDDLYEFNCNPKSTTEQNMNKAHAYHVFQPSDTLQGWHERLGHVNKATIVKLATSLPQAK